VVGHAKDLTGKYMMDRIREKINVYSVHPVRIKKDPSHVCSA
jgi:hypothetical protein